MTIPVLDAHVHFWDLRNDWYPALAQMAADVGSSRLYSDFSPADYEHESGSTVDRMVHVSAVTVPGAHRDELAWADDMLAAEGVDARFVGTVDPTASPREMVADIDAQMAISPRFAGVRVLYGLEPDAPAAAVLLDALAERGLVFDLACGPDRLGAWARTLDRFPDLRVVLEHCGWPAGTGAEPAAQWRREIGAFAAQTRAMCKVSGLGMVTGDLSSSVLLPWMQTVVEAFGWSRVMYGSNMPIDRIAGEFDELLQAVTEFVDPADDARRRAFYADNAAAVYGFEVR